MPKWRGNYLKSTVQLMEGLSDEYDVLYVDYSYTFKDLLKATFSGNISLVKSILGIGGRIEKLDLKSGHSLKVLTLPPIIPANGFSSAKVFDFFTRINAKIVQRCIVKYSRKLKIADPIVVNAFQPFLGKWLKGKLNEKALIYYCYDEINAARWLSNHGKRYESEYIPIVDSVIVTSSELAKSKITFNSDLHIVHNGVDFDLFGRELDGYSKKDSNRKIIGYVGSVDDRIDFDLLEYLSEMLPHYSFQFIGRFEKGSESLLSINKCSNVQLLGAQNPENLAGLIESMDVCIVPFLENEFTRSIYPLKMNEYLSRGKPVVSTEFTDLSDFDGYIYKANSKEQFLEMIKKSIVENDQEMYLKRIELAKSNSWKVRANQFSMIIQNS
jgi:hypothetical protein